MESFLKKFVLNLLRSPDRGSKNNDHADFLRKIIIRGDSNHFSKGDIIIPLKAKHINNVIKSNTDSPLYTCVTNPSDESFAIVREFLSSVSIPIKAIILERQLLSFFLVRDEITRSTLNDVIKSGSEYGKSRNLQSKKVLIIHDTSEEKTEKVYLYRGRTIFNHILKSLKFAGADVQSIHYEEITSRDSDTGENKSESIERLENRLQELGIISKENQIRFCLRCSGKSTAIDDPRLGQVLKYKHLINTQTGKAWRESADTLLGILESELRIAMELKYGDVDSEEQKQFLRQQASQCMDLLLLSKNFSDDLRVDVAENSQNTKDWAFVLYNYARLKMIFKSFESQVAKGTLSPLPDTEEIDFSLLKNDEEWSLVWEYIIRWPELMEEFITAFSLDPGKIKTSSISKFLHTLAHRFSVYYRRYRVLVSGEFPHLMPLMYARLYLLKSLQIVMEICFELIGIDSPPECM